PRPDRRRGHAPGAAPQARVEPGHPSRPEGSGRSPRGARRAFGCRAGRGGGDGRGDACPARVRRRRRSDRGRLPPRGFPGMGPARALPRPRDARGRVRASDPPRGGTRAGPGRRGRGSAVGMRRLSAIIAREWRAYFFSPLAYVILAAFLLMNGLIFYAIVSFLNQPGAPKGQALPYLFTNTYFWLFNLFVVPIIAMRLFAEERKSGTIELLL